MIKGDVAHPQQIRPKSDQARIQAKVRQLLRNNSQFRQIWDQLFGHLTAMGMDAQQLQALPQSCMVPESDS